MCPLPVAPVIWARVDTSKVRIVHATEHHTNTELPYEDGTASRKSVRPFVGASKGKAAWLRALAFTLGLGESQPPFGAVQAALTRPINLPAHICLLASQCWHGASSLLITLTGQSCAPWVLLVWSRDVVHAVHEYCRRVHKYSHADVYYYYYRKFCTLHYCMHMLSIVTYKLCLLWHFVVLSPRHTARRKERKERKNEGKSVPVSHCPQLLGDFCVDGHVPAPLCSRSFAMSR